MRQTSVFRTSTRAFACVIAAGIVGLWGAGARSEPAEPQQFTKQLAEGAPFTARVQAALALGASDSEDAVEPLCRALDDDVAIVRAAAASSLARLVRPSAQTCLDARAAKETNTGVKAQIDKALARVKKGVELNALVASSRAPKKGDRFYVRVEATKSKVDRRKNFVELLVHASVRKRLMDEQKVGLAPFGQDQKQFVKLAKGAKQQGYLLQPVVDGIVYADDKVSVALRLTLYSYPAMALKGEYSLKLSMADTPQRDTDAEDTLLQMVSEQAVESFLETTR